ncbi:MAG: DUF3313 domain-containing protein [Nitrospirales bacterium]|nr:DUF3313 domain-containing protein [Nitrospirales bacterium]
MLVLFCLSCTSAPKEQPITFSGFLGYYTGFRPSPNEDGSWMYEKPGLQLGLYHAVMVDPLVIWNNPDPKRGGINDVDAWKLQLTFRDRIVKTLGNAYPVVDQQGPNVLRIRAALTDVAEEKATSKANSPGPLLGATGDLLRRSTETLFSTNILAGKASLEAEILDSQTGERLIGYIEKRESSRNYVSDDRHNLGPIVDIFDYWAKKLRQRLDRARG